MAAPGSVLPPPNIFSKAEQARLLADAREKVRHYGFAMKRSVDANKLQDALQNATLMISELRTSNLTPKVYYDLYMEVFDQLGFLELYFMQLHRSGVHLSRVYEAVQLTGNVLPRLYLMITAGAVYIKSGQGKAKDVLADLLEMTKGVQHPQRGLFLRHYLAQKCKDKLPDAGSPFEGAGGSVGDALSFVIANFGEMNRLWVRLQHMSAANKGKKRRERERQELRLLVGAQLSRLSMLSGLDAPLFAGTVLPRLLTELVACRDRIAQPYLTECIVQAFPVDFTYATLPALLEALARLVPEPAVAKACFHALLTRLAEEALSATESLEQAAASGDAAAAALLAAKPADKRLPGLLHAKAAGAAGSESNIIDGGAGSSSGKAATSATSSASAVSEALDVFALLLEAINGIARDPRGAFRSSPAAAAAGRGGGDDDGASAAGGGAASPAAERGVPAAPAVASPEAVGALLETYTALMAFALKCYPGHLPYADAVLASAAESLRTALGAPAAGNDAAGGAGLESPSAGDASGEADAGSSKGGKGKKRGPPPALPPSLALEDDASKQIVSLLGQVQGSLGLAVLSLDHYASLMAPLRFAHRRAVAGKLLDAVLAAGQRVASPDTARRLCLTLSPLLRDEDASATGATGGAGAAASGSSSDEASEGFASEQARVARLVQLFGATTDKGMAAACAAAAAKATAGGAEAALAAHAAPDAPEADTDTHFDVLAVAHEHLSHGGARRVAATFPPLVFATLALLRRIGAREAAAAAAAEAEGAAPHAALRHSYTRVFEWLTESVVGLAATHTELALRLALQCALSAQSPDIADELFSQAFICFEELGDSKAQARCLHMIISALRETAAVDRERYAVFVQRAAQTSAKLLARPDQVRAALACASLMWRGPLVGLDEFRLPDQLLRCLQRAVTVAGKAPAQPALLPEVLDAFVYYYEKGVATIGPADIGELIARCRSSDKGVESMKAGPERTAAAAHLASTLRHIASARLTEEGARLYAEVAVE